MSLRVVPRNTNTALRPTSAQLGPWGPAAAAARSCGGGPLRLGRCGSFPRLSASAFRTRAAVEERAAANLSFYDLLEISESGSFDDIKRAYKQMARKYHPDVSPPDRAEEYTRRFIEVQEAYETLSDPRLRALYDRDLARGLHLAFSARRRADEELEPMSGWRNRWQDQVAGLKRRSTNKDSEGNLSWGARMRRQRAESSAQ
ncbi:chaperone protein dnaJ 20, chloroplastic-like [Canna indica]|uniref:Chaperone protein dnaJ 20, chloroplastic-like n=1 Tax=Canna indica TaxID=4628 RepID=A0AAQ3QAC4_9LILI|nr:chaperone protein dnaJ 20, chloroplastic-like [Canna indica]